MSGAQGSADVPVSCSTSQPRPRRRPPPCLRTKTGCLTCRKRRKKCDERKPLCQACERLELDCGWEDADHQLVDRRLRRQSQTSLAPPPKQLSGLSPFASTHDQSLFSFFNTNILPSLLRKHVHPAYSDPAPLYSIACSCPWLMNAILALSSHHLSWLQSKNGDPAVPYYAKAVRDLRKNMGSMSPGDDSLLSTVTFLGLYEELRSDNFSHHMVHFNTSSQILKARMGELKQWRDGNFIFLRIHAESAMYHLSTRALFAESLPDERDWAHLQQYLSTRPPSGAAEWTESPLLGSIPHVFTLILETTRLSRAAPLNDALMEKAKGYLDEIQEDKLRLASFQSRIAAEYDELEPTLELEVYCIPRLYLLALEIFLFKIMGPVTTHAGSPEIQKRADEAHALFQTAPFLPVRDEMRFGPDPTYPFTESNCWPLLIIGCATTREEHMVALKAVFLNLWRVRYSGYVRRVIRVVDAAWKTNRAYCESTDAPSSGTASTPGSASTAPMDGLDVLLHGQGSGWGGFSRHLQRGISPSSLDAFAVMHDWRQELKRPELES